MCCFPIFSPWLKNLYTYITRSSNMVQRDVQMRAAVLRGHFSSPALIPAVDYKLYPILCQLTFVPYTLHLYIFNLWPEINHHVLIPNFRVWCRGSFLLRDVAAARTRTRRRARTTASTEDEWVIRNLRRSRMVKQREKKNEQKWRKRSQKGLAIWELQIV